jgi:nucleoside-diphosphate-sugar epimerase
MKIAVTGGSGRIGRYTISELIKHKHYVTNIDINQRDIPGSQFQRIDITDFQSIHHALLGHDAVIHLGAWAYWGIVSHSQTYGENVQGTYNVFQACADIGIKRIVFASSNHVYGFGKDGSPPVYVALDELHPYRPASCYGLSKMAGEQAADYFSKRYGLEILSFRILGARSPQVLNSEIEKMAADPASGTHLLWTRMDTRDIAQACRLAVETNSVENGHYNITGGRVVLEEKSMDLVERYFGAATKIKTVVDGYRSPFDISKAQRILGYEPRYLWSVKNRFLE